MIFSFIIRERDLELFEGLMQLAEENVETSSAQ
jgi:hypothetical protein